MCEYNYLTIQLKYSEKLNRLYPVPASVYPSRWETSSVWLKMKRSQQTWCYCRQIVQMAPVTSPQPVLTERPISRSDNNMSGAVKPTWRCLNLFSFVTEFSEAIFTFFSLSQLKQILDFCFVEVTLIYFTVYFCLGHLKYYLHKKQY